MACRGRLQIAWRESVQRLSECGHEFALSVDSINGDAFQAEKAASSVLAHDICGGARFTVERCRLYTRHRDCRY